jgi:hypothetical protein
MLSSGMITHPFLFFLKTSLTQLKAEILSQKVTLKVVSSEKIGGSGVTSTLGTWYVGVVMGILFYPLMRPLSCIKIPTVRRHKSKI